ncbi:MAG: leucine-rich repeat protein [Clostridiales bacterium]|nr:leucine-rich repeat protein [Clostridiales bacterium]
MKRKNFRLNLASFVVFLLVGVMGVTAAFTAFIGNSIINPNVSTNSAIQAGQAESDLASALDPDKIVSSNKALSKDDKVVLIVTMDENTLIDTYLANPGSYSSFSDYRLSTDGKNAAENLINKQKALYNKIARQVDVTLKYNYVNTLNGFAIEIRYGDRKAIDGIADRANVLGTMISETYNAPEIQAVENHVAAMGTGIFDSTRSREELKIAGQGMVAAVLDTGLDWEHIAFDPSHPLFDLENQKKNNTLKFTKDYVKSRLSDLVFANGMLSLSYQVSDKDEMKDKFEDGENGTGVLTVDDVYRNEKVPFTFDYADYDTEVNSHVDNAHGTHVAGIIAGHSDDPKGEHGETLYDKDGKIITGITGVAPQAQLAIFKVFSDYEGGASSYSLLGALEDCITLDVDVINMSLGSTAGFQEDVGAYNSVYRAYESVGRAGISLLVAAGNEYSSSFNSHAGLNLTSNPDSGSVGSPASYDAAFAVASISGVKSQYLEATYNGGTATAYYNESAKVNGTSYNFMEDIWNTLVTKLSDPEIDNSVKTTLLGYINSFMYEDAAGTTAKEDGKKYSQFEKKDITLSNLSNVLEKMRLVDASSEFVEYELQIPYVTISGVGNTGNYAGKDVKNKIALVSRGQINFEDKLKEATRQGALACIVFNNAAGIIRMQVGDNITIPSCSITMDVAALIKNKDNSGAAYFTVNPQKKAGPFMSDFSNWGPLPNLVLKPEITAHGGEIYSAIPGDETAYSRFSGTSMACPNMAGVVTLLRQYMKQADVAAKFELYKDGELDLNIMEQRIYQILMSTATIAHNEEDNPYSPRKQGAGLADLDRSETTEQYLYVMKNGVEQERTKVELGDDPSKKGEYTVEFYVKNVGSSSASYTISSHVMTEGISSDEKTVTEKSRMLTDYTAALKVDGVAKELDSTITVAAKSSVKITYTITLGDKDREWLANFKNGMYVDGFVRLINEDKVNGIDLNIPYLAFYGDWSDAPIIDYEIYETSKDLNDDTIDEDDKRYSNAQPIQLLGKYTENGQEYSFPMGSYVFNLPEGYTGPDAEADKAAVSFNTDSAISGIYGVAGFLRGAKRLFWEITDAVTGDYIYGSTYRSARKASAASGYGGAYFEIDMTQMDFVNNHKYTFTCYPVLDWHADQFKTKQDVIDYNINKMLSRCECSDKERCIVNEDCQDANCACEDNRIRYYWSTDFWYDTDAPFISNTELRVVRDSSDNASYYLDMYLTDNHYIQAMSLTAYDKDKEEYVSTFDPVDGTLRPIITQRNATTLVSLNLTYMWEQIQDGILYQLENLNNAAAIAAHPELGTYLTQFKVTLYDYAFNTSYYTIDLMELYEYMESVQFGDIGNYATYSYTENNVTNQVNVMTSYNDTPKEDSTLRSVTIIKGQKIELMKAVVPTPATAWREDFVFTSSAPAIVRVNDETGEIYAEGAGEATVTITSRVNRNASATLTVKVLSLEDAAKYKIPVSTLQADQNLNSLSFKVSGWAFDAGEEYIIELEHDPWYYELESDIISGKYFIRWTSSNDRVAAVRPMTRADAAKFGEEYSIFKAVVTANRGSDYDGEYVKNISAFATVTAQLCKISENGKNNDPVYGAYDTTVYSAQFAAYVYEEFVTTGNELTEYHGTPILDEKTGLMTVTIPSNLNITTIASSLFYERKGIEYIIFPEGLETIGRAACAYMIDLRRVKFPSTLQKIDQYAFIAKYETAAEGPVPGLSIVDTSDCAKPLQIAAYAFANQKYIGVDIEASIKASGGEANFDFGDDKDGKNKIVLISEADRELFNTKMVRVVDKYAFANLAFVSKLDLTGLRGASIGAFFNIGSSLHNHFNGENGPKYADVIFGENTYAGIAAFVGNGIGKVTLPMRRISAQMFYGLTEEQEDVHEDEEQENPDADVETKYTPSYIGELEEITFTADNVVIEMGAFIYSSVKKVTFEKPVYSIGEAAFAYSKIEEINFKNGCREIGNQAFFATEIGKTADGEAGEFKLPAGLEKLGTAAFSQCEYIGKLVIDKNCKWTTENGQVSASAGTPFYGCKNLAEFEVEPDNAYLTSKNGVIYNKEGDMLIAVPGAKEFTNANDVLDGVTKIGDYAFGANTYIEKADISGIEEFGDGIFFMCSALTEVTLPQHNITDLMFYECTSLKDVNFPATIDDTRDPITKIGQFAFYKTVFERIELPNTISEIGMGAFAENTELKAITLPSNVTEIADTTFYGCSSLALINTVSPSADSGFTENGNLTRITRIGVGAFCYTAIPSIRLINCTYIAEQAFAGCSNLESVDLRVATYIGDYAFAPGNNEETGESIATIKTVNIPMAKTLGTGAFYYQNKLEAIELDACTEIGALAFYSCTSLTKVYMPQAKTIGMYAFANTAVNQVYPDKELDLPEYYRYLGILSADLEYIHPTAFIASSVLGYVFYGENPRYFQSDELALYRYVEGGYELVAVPTLYQQSTEFTVMDGTIRIGNYAFYFNQYIFKVNIPDSVRWIGDGAFASSDVRIYNFETLQAPELEAGYATTETENGDVYFWQMYNNFYQPFTYSPDGGAFKYNSIRMHDEYDKRVDLNSSMQLQNESYTGGGFTGYPYGMVVERPSNAKGFDNFIWANYFDSTLLMPELMEDTTRIVMDLIRALPEANKVTVAHRDDIESARGRYDSLSSFEQQVFVIKEGLLDRLEACEQRLAEIDGNDAARRQAVKDLINELPDPADITLKDKDAVVAAREAYDALTSTNQSVFATENAALVTKLEQCEAKISELEDKGGEKEGCGSCGTVAFGAGNNGGTGLMVGLFAVMLVSLLVVLLRKKKSAQK